MCQNVYILLLKNHFLLVALAGFKGNLSLLETCFFFSRGLKQMAVFGSVQMLGFNFRPLCGFPIPQGIPRFDTVPEKPARPHAIVQNRLGIT